MAIYLLISFCVVPTLHVCVPTVNTMLKMIKRLTAATCPAGKWPNYCRRSFTTRHRNATQSACITTTASRGGLATISQDLIKRFAYLLPTSPTYPAARDLPTREYLLLIINMIYNGQVCVRSSGISVIYSARDVRTTANLLYHHRTQCDVAAWEWRTTGSSGRRRCPV